MSNNITVYEQRIELLLVVHCKSAHSKHALHAFTPDDEFGIKTERWLVSKDRSADTDMFFYIVFSYCQQIL